MNIAAYSLGIPKIENLKDFSNEINLSEYTLQRVLSSVNKQYNVGKIPKKDQSFRTIFIPSNALRAIQTWILRNILDLISIHPSAMAFRKNTTIKNNVEVHIDNQFYLCMDVQDYFPSVGKNKVYQLFHSIGFNKQMALIFSNFCTYENFLPQGAVTSPSISNLVNIKLDRRINGFCSIRNIVYTRYADDFVFSSNNSDKLKKSISTLKTIIEDEGYKLNDSKTRLLSPGNKRKITGLIVSDKNKISIGREKRRKLRARIHHSIFKLEEDKNLASWYEMHINGWLSFLKDVDQISYQHLVDYKMKLEDKKKKQDELMDELTSVF
ncbi:hypothetical protein DH09_05285 [Bacillaceae bacterium JMAK1]|nr:hypothetical protein DH09_05285 [Bacillaceae bacterium JMAK1]